MNRYWFIWGEESWISYGEWLAHPREPWFFEGSRIIIREITGEHPHRIMAAVTDEDFVTYKTILNLKLPQDAMASDPSNADPQLVTRIANLAKRQIAFAIKTKSANTDIDAEIDRHVYALYGLTPAEIQLVEESAK